MQFIENRKKFYALSIILIVIGLLAMAFNAFKGNGAFAQDIEFTGGSYIHIDMEQPLTNDLKNELSEIVKEITEDSNPRITSADNNGAIITVQRADAATRTKLFEAIKAKYNLSSEEALGDADVSASISGEIKWGAIKAVLVGALLILLYITFRFKDLRFGASAVIALLHDVFIMLAVYAVFRIPLNNSFIAAILTIVGYSINDTIIIFDRIRENRDRKGIKNNAVVDSGMINASIKQTMTRSISTSLTTVIMVVLLYFLGTDSVKQFAFPIIIGVLAGTYSSIFIASPLWYDMSCMKSKKHK